MRFFNEVMVSAKLCSTVLYMCFVPAARSPESLSSPSLNRACRPSVTQTMKTIGFQKSHVTRKLSLIILNFKSLRLSPQPVMTKEHKTAMPNNIIDNMIIAKTSESVVSPSRREFTKNVYRKVPRAKKLRVSSLQRNFVAMTGGVSSLLNHFGFKIRSNVLIFATVRILALPNNLVDLLRDLS
mmetsp:Transcript_12647/g.16918  ORF Transcript_12647/g.16918 Transcript_12647/m.16918 type:complete len:183 (+) Transcript_12647:461-1009(+)